MIKKSIREYPPASKRYLNELINKVFIPATKGVSSTIISLSGFGKSALTRYLIDNCGTLWGKDVLDHLWIQIDCEKVFAIEDLISQIKFGLSSNFDKDQLQDFEQIKHLIKDTTWASKLSATLVIDNTHLLAEPTELNRSIIKTLVGLNELNVTAIHFIFISTVDLPNLPLNNLGRLTRQLTANVFYLQALDEESVKVVFDKEEFFTKETFNESFRSVVSTCANGDPSIIRLLTKRAQVSPTFIKDFTELQSLKQRYEMIGVETLNERFTSLIANLSLDECDLLVAGSSVPVESLLVKTGFLKDGKVPTNSLFSYFVDRYMNEVLSGMREQTTQLIEMQLTPQQREIFEYLKSNKDKVVSREEIAKYIWGDLWSVKYSDWAIDKQISEIRKYSERLGFSLQAVRGKGVRLT